MGDETEVNQGNGPKVYDAFLVRPKWRPSDVDKTDRHAPDGVRAFLQNHTKAWPRRFCVRAHLHEGEQMLLVTPVPESTMLYPFNDPRHPEARYDWTEVRPGVLGGVLRDPAERAREADIIVDRRALGLTD